MGVSSSVAGSVLIQTLLVMIHVRASEHDSLGVLREGVATREFQTIVGMPLDRCVSRVNEGTVADGLRRVLSVFVVI